MLFFFAIVAAACNKGFEDYWKGDNPKGGFLYNKIKANPQFSTFSRGLERASLEQFMSKGGLYTVFAPTNAAFDTYLKARGWATIEDVPVDTLFKVLSFHIVSNMWYYYDFRTRFLGASKQKLYLTRSRKFLNVDVSTENKIIVNGTSNVINELRDIDSENGVIHGIDQVLVPRLNLEEFMASDPEISQSSFYKLLQLTADKQYDPYNSLDKNRDNIIDSVFFKVYPLIDRFNAAIEYTANQNNDNQGGTPVFTTVLIPSNAVFDAYLAPVLAKNGGKIENLSPNFAESVIENLVFADTSMLSSTILNRQVTPETKVVNATPYPTAVLRSAGDFKRKDIQLSNGMIHVLNVMPAVSSDRQLSALGQGLTDPELTTFYAALQKAGLLGTWSNSTKAATILAPTNAAFAAENIDVKTMSINGAALTSTQFSDFVKTHLIGSNLIKTALTGTINSDVGATQPLIFSNNGTTVTSPSGAVATILHPPVAIGPKNVGYLYKVDKVVMFKR